MLRNQEKHYTITERDQDRYEAVLAIASLFELSNMAYVMAIENYGVSREDAERQMERYLQSSPKKRREMLAHIETVMGIDQAFALEVGPHLEIIKDVLGIE